MHHDNGLSGCCWFMKWLFQGKWWLAGFGFAAIITGLVNSISYQNAQQLIESTNRSRQTYEVIKNLVDVFAEMTVAESGRRGFVYLNDENELARYRVAVGAIALEMQALELQLADSPNETRLLKKLDRLLQKRLFLLDKSIQLYQRDRNAHALQSEITTRSIQLRGEIQAVIADLKRNEEQLLHQWLTHSQASIRSRIWLEFLVTIFSFALLLSVLWIVYQQLLKRQEAEALSKVLEQEKELSDLKLGFFSMVSHEFRTPLSVILGSSQLLAEGNHRWNEAQRLKNIHRIQSSAQLMTQLLTDMLMLTRAEAGKLECKPEPLDIESFCLNLVEEIQLLAVNHQPIQFSRKGHCGLVKLDEKLLYSILSNLLLNALKYSPAEATIQLILECEPDYTKFWVSDRGMGIAPDDLAQIFQPFHRGQNVANIPGSGLGLAVVKTCVELHQGEISVRSEIGEETTFLVKIPCVFK